MTVTHSRTRDLAAITRTADIVIAAIGLPNFIRAEHVKDGAVVIDVGSIGWTTLDLKKVTGLWVMSRMTRWLQNAKPSHRSQGVLAP